MKSRPREWWTTGRAVAWTMAAVGVAVEVGIGLRSWAVDISTWGTWLQGVLTPVALVFAALTLRSGQVAAKDQAALQLRATAASAAASREQAALQVRAASIAQQAAILSNIDKLHGHLDYAASCAVFNERLSLDELKGVPLVKQGFARLLHLLPLTGDRRPLLPNSYRRVGRPGTFEEEAPDVILQSSLFRDFLETAREIVEMASSAGVAFLVDQRVKDIVADVREAPATVVSPPFA